MKNLIKTSAAVIAATLLGACNFEQSTPPCAVGHGGYGAQYTYVSGNSSGACFRKGDIIGVQKYRTVDSDAQTVHLRPEVIGIGEFAAGFDSPELSAGGPLTANEPDAEGFCSVPTLSVATGLTNAGNATLSYAFSNVKFYVDGAVAGTQFSADLTISSTDPAACSTTYTVKAMYPVVFCNDVSEPGSATYGAPSEALCDQPDHVWSHYSANPKFDSTCNEVGSFGVDYDYLADPDFWGRPDLTAIPDPLTQAWHLCTPTTAIPSLK